QSGSVARGRDGHGRKAAVDRESATVPALAAAAPAPARFAGADGDYVLRALQVVLRQPIFTPGAAHSFLGRGVGVDVSDIPSPNRDVRSGGLEHSARNQRPRRVFFTLVFGFIFPPPPRAVAAAWGARAAPPPPCERPAGPVPLPALSGAFRARP